MKIIDDLFSELEKLQLFVNCGSPFNFSIDFEIVTLKSWWEVMKSITDKYWEEISQEEQGILTSYLSQKHPQKYHGNWNKTVREIRPKLEKIVDPQVIKLIERKSLDPSLKDCVRWDMLNAVMVMIYERERCNPPLFFKHLYEIYKNGHIPCGWQGTWPEGKLIIY